jgi:hypothetical protein
LRHDLLPWIALRCIVSLAFDQAVTQTCKVRSRAAPCSTADLRAGMTTIDVREIRILGQAD